MELLSSGQKRELKSKAQRLKPMVRLGRQGITQEFLKSVADVIQHHPLLKIRLEAFKEERFELGEKIATETGSHLVAVLGNVVTIYKPKAEANSEAKSADQTAD